MAPRTTNSRLSAAIAAGLFAAVAVGYLAWHSGGSSNSGPGPTSANADAPNAPITMRTVSICRIRSSPRSRSNRSRSATFPSRSEAVGSIDFNEDMAVQVFTPYQGRIIALFAEVGDDVKKGQTLFTIDSPDLLQAEVDFDRGCRRVGTGQQKPRSPARSLYDAGGFSARRRAGDLRPADRRG